MKDYRTEQIRNVVLVSHGGAGKTSLAEAMLYGAGAISRLGRVDEGTSTSDFDADEIKRKMSVNISLLPLEWKERKVNILDTPGYADFVSEVKSGVRVADGAVVVVCAASGVEVGTERVWAFTEERSLPRLLFLNKMDRENANFAQTLAQIRSQFGSRCAPVQIPIGSESSFNGVVDLIEMKAYTGPEMKEAPVPVDLHGEAQKYREQLVETLADRDDVLMEKYLEGEDISTDEIRNAVRRDAAAGVVVPVLVGSALQVTGITPLLDAISSYLPSPADAGTVRAHNPATEEEEELPVRVDAPLAALVFKTTADPYVGKLTYFRVFAGLMQSDSQVWNTNKAHQERIGQLFVMRGKAQEPAKQLPAGDIGAVAKLSETSTNDTLCSRDHPVALAPIEFPAPVYSAAVYPKTKADLDKLGASLARLVEEDPTLRTYKEPDTNETILSGMGESHVEVAAEKMHRKFGVDVKVELPRVAYKETITQPVKAEYKHKKQTGGHGQYGHVLLELEPLPRGSGFEFSERVVGGAVPRNYIPAVEKGVQEAVQEGVLARYPVADVRVLLYDGSYHPVDSSEMSFKIASSQAFKKGMSAAQPVLLEPIMSLRIRVPESATGDVIGDLNTKRARVLGMTPVNGASEIEAQAPLADLLRYATDLRSLTQGRGTFSMEFDHYEEVPAHVAQKIIADAKKEQEKA